MLQRFEATDHGLDAGADLFVALHQRGPLTGEAVLTLAQRAILLAQGTERIEQLVHLLLKTTDFGVEGDLVAHAQNYSRVFGIISFMSAPDFREIERQLAGTRALTDLPEAHGTLAGALCSSSGVTLQDWLREVFPEGLAGSAETPMLTVYEWTRHVLESGQLEFQLLLPDDDEPVAIRAAALGQWCQGFLYGLGSNPIPDIDQLPEQVGEIVRDLTAMTRIDVDESESTEDNEQAYSELVEFVRIGVQLLHDELAGVRESATAGGDADDKPPSIH